MAYFGPPLLINDHILDLVKMGDTADAVQACASLAFEGEDDGFHHDYALDLLSQIAEMTMKSGEQEIITIQIADCTTAIANDYLQNVDALLAYPDHLSSTQETVLLQKKESLEGVLQHSLCVLQNYLRLQDVREKLGL